MEYIILAAVIAIAAFFAGAIWDTYDVSDEEWEEDEDDA